ncbi:MAG TPA: ATP-binding cassette domain-containing protein, partial [Acidobacteriota bacterium]|nr:ATP-binding cassette domain-containing protein [Acidobacteriota bacterium]
HIDTLVNQISGVHELKEGSLTILGKNTRRMDERSWFQFVEKLGIYNSQPVFQESASIGENVASLYRVRNDLMEEPQLSASVLSLANLVQLSITDLSRQMSEASPVQRMKVRLSRALAYSPLLLIVCDSDQRHNAEVTQTLSDLIRKARRKLKLTLILFSSDLWLIEQLADRAVFLNPNDGQFIENQLRGWYHKLLPFLKPSPAQLLQLPFHAMQHSLVMRESEERLITTKTQRTQDK